MTKQYEKFLATQDKKLRVQFLNALKAIETNNYLDLDLEKLSGHKDIYRIRIWKWRILFRRALTGNMIIKIESRWGVYKWL